MASCDRRKRSRIHNFRFLTSCLPMPRVPRGCIPRKNTHTLSTTAMDGGGWAALCEVRSYSLSSLCSVPPFLWIVPSFLPGTMHRQGRSASPMNERLWREAQDGGTVKHPQRRENSNSLHSPHSTLARLHGDPVLCPWWLHLNVIRFRIPSPYTCALVRMTLTAVTNELQSFRGLTL